MSTNLIKEVKKSLDVIDMTSNLVSFLITYNEQTNEKQMILTFKDIVNDVV